MVSAKGKRPCPIRRALKKSISSHIARYSTIKSLNTSLFSFGTVNLLLFSEAFRSLSAGERRAHSCQLKKCVLLLKSGIDIYKTFLGRGAFDVDTETYTITPKAI